MNPMMMMAAAAAAQGRHRRAVADAGRRFRRRPGRLAEVQPLSENRAVPRGIRVRRSRRGRQGAVQPQGRHQRRPPAGPASLPRLDEQAERVRAGVHSLAADGQDDGNGFLRRSAGGHGAAPRGAHGEEYVLAAHIRGKLKPNPQMAGEKDAAKEKAAAGKKAARPAPAANAAAGNERGPRGDVDMISPAFFQLREQAEMPELGIRLDFDNVTFVLNTLDELAGDNRFIAVRSHRPQHRTLTRIEEQTKAAKSEAAEQREKYYKECTKKEEDEQAELDKRIADLQSRKDANAMDVVNEARHRHERRPAAAWNRTGSGSARSATGRSRRSKRN